METTSNWPVIVGQLLRQVAAQRPLVHCITHPITMNDSANLILAVGAIPNMASHPQEVAEITASSDVLSVNLGNITDDRMKAMQISGQQALRLGKPVVIDIVGAACSTLRRTFAEQFIQQYKPAVIKGNASEIRCLCGLPSHAEGADAGSEDLVCQGTDSPFVQAVTAYAQAHKAVVMASGPVDVITDGVHCWGVANGTPYLARMTGTGCMLGALTAVYTAHHKPVEAAVLAAVMMGLAGEKAAEPYEGMGTFHYRLLDAFSTMTTEEICRQAKILDIQ